VCDHCGCRAFPAIAELTEEHEQILELAWEVAEAAPHSAVGTAARAQLHSLLAAHVAVEEEVFYPLLVATGDLPLDACAVLEAEHRDLGAALDGRFDRRSFYALAAHIENEEMELFPAAMFAFEDEDWAALQAAARPPG
jgi:hemerythrin-like domain-containing protein